MLIAVPNAGNLQCRIQRGRDRSCPRCARDRSRLAELRDVVGPCNAISDYTKQIYLQPPAASSLCGSLAHTTAHEMAHMCGIGPDVFDEVNRKKANDIGFACSGGD
jgi:hypothetical protein